MNSYYMLKLAIAAIITFLGISWILQLLINDTNHQKFIAYGTVIGALVGVLALFFIGYQAIHLRKSFNLHTEELKLLADRHQLENRPYLYLHLELIHTGVWMNPDENAYFGGGDLYFENVGKVPASIIKAEYLVASDVHNSELQKWFDDAYGGFPSVKTVFPNQKGLKVPCHPIISPNNKKPKLMYIGALIQYTGTNPKEIFWYKFSQLFIITFETVVKDGQAVEAVSIQPHKPDHEWDMNNQSPLPSLEEPDWNYYLSRKYIKRITNTE